MFARVISTAFSRRSTGPCASVKTPRPASVLPPPPSPRLPPPRFVRLSPPRPRPGVFPPPHRRVPGQVGLRQPQVPVGLLPGPRVPPARPAHLREDRQPRLAPQAGV